MSNYAPASRPLPYRLPAAEPFAIGWALAEQDGTAFGAPLSVAGLTDVNVAAVQRVARGLTPPAPTVWTMSGGQVSLATVEVGGVAYPYLALAGEAPAPGDYAVTVSLDFGGALMLLLDCTFQVVAIP
jgi:hypothetical protein